MGFLVISYCVSIAQGKFHNILWVSVYPTAPKAPGGTNIAYLFLNTQDPPSSSLLSKRVGIQKFSVKVIFFFFYP